MRLYRLAAEILGVVEDFVDQHIFGPSGHSGNRVRRYTPAMMAAIRGHPEPATRLGRGRVVERVKWVRLWRAAPVADAES